MVYYEILYSVVTIYRLSKANLPVTVTAGCTAIGLLVHPLLVSDVVSNFYVLTSSHRSSPLLNLLILLIYLYMSVFCMPLFVYVRDCAYRGRHTSISNVKALTLYILLQLVCSLYLLEVLQTYMSQ